MVVGAIAVVVGALLPWTRVGGGSESLGVDGTGGLLALTGGASALGAGLGLIWLRRTSLRALAVAGGLGGLVAALAALSEFPRVRNELIEFVGHAFGATSHGFTALPGVYVALAGGLTSLAASISIIARRLPQPRA